MSDLELRLLEICEMMKEYRFHIEDMRDDNLKCVYIRALRFLRDELHDGIREYCCGIDLFV
jgi:hypothetical protein